ncbi:DNA polymerase/3'-5' exonuclease PolX [Sulfuriroseicoccus oceanibius]|uniref:DNA polymerase beta n=1 Tax=Sulfuriroseicoccus oceanibius TaxID=2707525 RepID=A0A6B3L5K9_9BACT|nr:DNA polymerase/3'-5' exonuclease PolX [Sulfuriroseicoccus oceanibius]QQL45031.1 DNA polymerase/3'-5' exonuclease PolX [Sulfuriroseicoccus oceanibius]
MSNGAPNVSRDTLATTLEQIATLLELQGENPFKTRAYRNGAETVRSYDGDIVAIAANNELAGIPGIGKALQDKLHELASTGKLEFYDKLRAQFPDTIFELFEIQGLGPKKIKALYQELEVGSIARLKEVCESGEVSQLGGFGKKTVANILEAIAFREQNASSFDRKTATHAAEMICDFLRTLPDAGQIEVAGSLRRGKETVGDLDFLVTTKNPQAVCDAFAAAPFVDRTIAHGSTKVSINLDNGLQCDLRAISADELPFALSYFTGSKEHNVEVRSRMRKRGVSLNEYGLTPIDEANAPEIPEIRTEADLYKFLELDYIPPALRENRGEFDAAAEGTLPRLIELGDLRGTFHNHTVASDGNATLREMAEAAIDLGLEYLGIADHSKSSFQANGLDASRLQWQIDEIRKLNDEFKQEGVNFRVFAGSEVDILKDGSLDFPDDVLAQLDYVVASVHNAFTLPEAQQTQRIIDAISNPHVTMLGHLTGRLLLKREPYAVDVNAVIDAAAETKTIIELNANPRRLDMDWRHWHSARDRGVLCSINPDAHSTKGLQMLRFGIDVARKGWLRKQDVLNTRTTREVERYLNL